MDEKYDACSERLRYFSYAELLERFKDQLEASLELALAGPVDPVLSRVSRVRWNYLKEAPPYA